MKYVKKPKKRGTLPNQKDALAVKRKKYIMDVLDQLICFDFDKTQLTLLSKLLDHIQLTPITFTVTKNTHKTHSHKKPPKTF